MSFLQPLGCRSGPFFFISGNEANCRADEKLIVVLGTVACSLGFTYGAGACTVAGSFGTYPCSNDDNSELATGAGGHGIVAVNYPWRRDSAAACFGQPAAGHQGGELDHASAAAANDRSGAAPVVVGVIFFLSVSTYVDYKAIERRAEIGVRVFAAPLAAITVFVLFLVLQHCRRYWTLRQHYAPAVHQPTVGGDGGGGGGGSSTWVVALLSSVHSIWFRPLWDSDYY
ncbi:hypothetical protein E2562_015455 [Oryza meyeriana var. granulata]|uniref:Uncharacterized protein n=1 Tax=Oryza meyeriana var. granulata TaxID=110450 RepID=A0A6G1BX54_9ORYZ|nr:hypothetical protein E2562_015455 [Oryza meyeriana var. granulata]